MEPDINDKRWLPIRENPPKTGDNFWGLLEHWYTHGKRVWELVAVDESDCSFRTADDNSEISYDWNVTHWMEIV